MRATWRWKGCGAGRNAPGWKVIALLVLSAGLSMGCRRSRCVPICEENARCAGAATIDCQKQCAEAVALSGAARCDDDLARLEECWDKRADRCAAGACAAEQQRYERCLTAYCQKNPGASGCP